MEIHFLYVQIAIKILFKCTYNHSINEMNPSRIIYMRAMGSSSGKILAAVSVLGVIALAGTLLLTGFIGVRQRIGEVVIEIDYFNNWNVTVSQNDSTQSWSGFGKMERTLIGPIGAEWVISITARKTDGSSSNLSVRIKQIDGTIVKEASTSAPFGTACISYTIK